MDSKKVAIVGGGYAGIAAFWALKKSPHDVYIFEANEHLGSLTELLPMQHENTEWSVDFGLEIFNAATSR